jgi:hypothetical protein
MTVLASPDIVELASSGVVCAANQLFICDLSGHVTKTLRKSAGKFFVRQNVLVVAQTASTVRVFDLRTNVQKLEFTPRGYHTLCGVTRDAKRILTNEFGKLDNRRRAFLRRREERAHRARADQRLDRSGRGVRRHVCRRRARAGVVSILSRDAKLERTFTYGAKLDSFGLTLSKSLVVARGTKSAPVIWDLATGESVRVDHHEPAGLLGGARCARFSGDGTRIITCGNDCRVVVSKIEL